MENELQEQIRNQYLENNKLKQEINLLQKQIDNYNKNIAEAKNVIDELKEN